MATLMGVPQPLALLFQFVLLHKMVSTPKDNVETVSHDGDAVPSVITVGDLFNAVAELMARTGRSE